MRTPQYQLKIEDAAVERWMDKVMHSIRALKDDTKKGHEWTYLHLVNLQDDMDYLAKFIDRRILLQMMRDTSETDFYDAPVAQSEEASLSNSD